MSTILDAVLDRTILFSFDRSGFLCHAGRFSPGDLDVDLTGPTERPRDCARLWHMCTRLAGLASSFDDPRSVQA